MKNKSKILVLSAIALLGMTAAATPVINGATLKQVYADADNVAFDFTSAIPDTITTDGSPSKDSLGRGFGKSSGGTFSFTTKSPYSNVTKVVVNSSTNGTPAICSVKVTVGGVELGSATLTSKDATNYQISGGPLSGVVKVENKNGNNNKSQWIAGFTVYYSNAAVETFDISFNLNGGSGTKADEHPNRSLDYTIPDISGITAPTGKVFDCWSGNNGSTYHAGDIIPAGTFAKDFSLTLTALWKEIPVMPTDFEKLTVTNGSGSVSDATFRFSGDTSDGIAGVKGGTSKAPGFSLKVTVPSGTNKLVIFAAGWNGSGQRVTVNDTTLDLYCDTGMNSNTPFTLSSVSLYDDLYRKEFDLQNITSSTEIEIEFNDRAGVWYVGYQADSIQSIAIKTSPKTTYSKGEKLDPSGLVITATYDGKTEDVSYNQHSNDFAFNPSLNTELTDQTSVTVTYKDKTASFNIDVKSLAGLVINQTPTTVTYRAGEKFDPTGIVVQKKLSHSNGNADTYETISSGFTYSIGGQTVNTNTSLTKGANQEVTVSYTEGGVTKTATFTINVGSPYVTSITPNETEVTLGPGSEYRLTAKNVLPEGADQGYTVQFISAEGALNGSFTFTDGLLKINDGSTATGDITLRIVSNDVKSDGSHAEADCIVHVIAAEVSTLTGVQITGTPDHETQYVGQNFDKSGLTFTPTFDNDPGETVTIGDEDIKWNKLVAGQHPTGSYTYNNVTVTVTVESVTVEEDALASIAISGSLEKTEYYENDSAFSAAGLTVTGTMKSGDPVSSISGATLTFEKTPSELGVGKGTVKVTASLNGVNSVDATFNVTILENALQSITADSSEMNKDYILGDTIDTTGLKINATYSNGTVTGIDSGFTTNAESIDMLSVGDKTLIVTYGGKTTSVTLHVAVKTFETTKSYNLVKEEQDDYSGKYVVAAYMPSSLTMYTLNASGFTGSDIKGGSIGKSVLSGVTTTTESFPWDQSLAANELVLTKKANGSYSCKVGDYYIGGSATNENSLFGVTSDNYDLTVTFDSTYGLIISSAAGTNFQMLNSKGSEVFRFYASSQKLPAFFKLEETQTGTADPIGMSEASFTGTGDFKAGDVITASQFSATIMYNDGNPKAATNLTINGGSTVTLSAGSNTIRVSDGTFHKDVIVVAREPIAVTSITDAQTTDDELFINQEAELSATVNPNDADDKLVTWSCTTTTDLVEINGNKIKVVSDPAEDTTLKFVAKANSDNSITSNEVTITVKANKLLDIEAVDYTNTATLNVPYTFDGKVVAHYTIDPTKDVDITSEVAQQISIDTATLGAKNATVTYGEKQTTVSVNVGYASVEQITISGTPEVAQHIGDEFKLTATVTPSNSNQSITWSTSDADIATIDTEGNVAIVGFGEVTFTATGADNKEATVTVNCVRDVVKQEVTVNRYYVMGENNTKVTYEDTIYQGMTVYADTTLTVTYNAGDPETYDVPVKLNTTNAGSQITQTAAVKDGNTTLFSADFKVAVAADTVETLTVSGNYKNTYVEGQSFNTKDMIVSAHWMSGRDTTVTDYEVTDGASLEYGKSTVTISYMGATTTADITVIQKAVESLEITSNPTKTIYFEGDNFNDAGLAVKAIYNDGTSVENVEFSVTNGSNLTKGMNSVQVSFGGKTINVPITVESNANVKSIYVDGTYTNTLKLGGEYTFDGKIMAEFDSGDRDITADVIGQISSQLNKNTLGKQDIEIIWNGKTCNVSITVQHADPTGVSITGDTTSTYKINQTAQLSATVIPSTASQTVTWSSNNNSIATVDANTGLVTFHAYGEVTITATTSNGKTTTVTLTCANPVTSVTLNKTTLEMDLEENYEATLVATVNPTDAETTNVTWISSDESVVSVDSNGSLIANKVGTAVITASCGGKEATCTITVTDGEVEPVNPVTPDNPTGGDTGVKIGCVGSVAASTLVVSLAAAAGAAMLVSKKRKEDK